MTEFEMLTAALWGELDYDTIERRETIRRNRERLVRWERQEREGYLPPGFTERARLRMAADGLLLEIK